MSIPLNPDALEASERWMQEKSATFGLHWKNAKPIIEAYFAVAQPLVTSLEELDSMPDGSIVKDSEGEVYIMTPYDEFWRVWGNDKRFSSGEIVLPARVLYLPEVKP